MSLVPTDITDELVTILRAATTRGGYPSNIGASVRVGELRGMAAQAPACFVIPSRGKPGLSRYSEIRQVVRDYEIKALVDMDDHPSMSDHAMIDQIIWDVRRCIEGYEPGVESLVERIAYSSDRPGYREEGGTIVGASLTYEVTYSVNLTDPETAI